VVDLFKRLPCLFVCAEDRRGGSGSFSRGGNPWQIFKALPGRSKFQEQNSETGGGGKAE